MLIYLFFISILIQFSPRLLLFPYTTLFRSRLRRHLRRDRAVDADQFRRLDRPGGLPYLGAFRLQRDVKIQVRREDRKSTRLNSSHVKSSYAVFCLKKREFLEALNSTIKTDI